MMATRAMATVTATTWLMATVTRLAGNEEGKGEGGKDDGNGDEGGGRQRGNGDGGKSDGDGDNGGRQAMAISTKRVMVMATRVGEVGGQRNGQWQWRQERWQWRQWWWVSDGDKEGDGDGDKGGRGWRATKRAKAMVARAMATTTRLEGKQQHPMARVAGG